MSSELASAANNRFFHEQMVPGFKPANFATLPFFSPKVAVPETVLLLSKSMTNFLESLSCYCFTTKNYATVKLNIIFLYYHLKIY
jgi:hypothetical protein